MDKVCLQGKCCRFGTAGDLSPKSLLSGKIISSFTAVRGFLSCNPRRDVALHKAMERNFLGIGSDSCISSNNKKYDKIAYRFHLKIPFQMPPSPPFSKGGFSS